MKVLYNE